MRSVLCVRCKEIVPEAEARQHTLDQCKAAAKTYVYIKHGLRPFPEPNSLPFWATMGAERDMTRGAWEGEPRAEQRLLAVPTKQVWVEHWIDVVVTLWAGPIHTEGLPRKQQRDSLLRELSTEARLQRMIVDAQTEDLRAVRELLRPRIVGPLPLLVAEWEAIGRG